MKSRNDLTQGTIWKAMLLFFLPVAAGTLFQQLYNTVDTIIVGRYSGTIALAAVGGSASHIVQLIINSFIGLTNGAAVVVSHLFGAGEKNKLNEASNTAVTFCALAGIVIGILGFIFAPWMISAMNTPADTVAGATLYLRYYFAGALFILIFNMGTGVMRACGDAKNPVVFLIITSVVHIVLDLVFVKNMSLGVLGVGLSTLISNFISALLVMYKMAGRDELYSFNILKPHIDAGILKKMIAIGVPTALESAMYGFSNLIVQRTMNSLGTVPVAAWSMASKVDGFYWATMTAVNATVMTFVGQNFGAGNIDRIKQGIKHAMIIFQAITLALIAALLLFSRPAFALFGVELEVIDLAVVTVNIMAPFYVIWTILQIYTGTLKGAGDAAAAALITGIGTCLLRIVWCFTVFAMYPVYECLCWLYPVTWVVTAAALFVRFKQGKWIRYYKETKEA